jgi:AAA domain
MNQNTRHPAPPQQPGSVRFQVAINRLWPGEKLKANDARWGDYNGAFRTEEHTPPSLFREVTMGHAFCAALSGYRKMENFVSSQVLTLDIDTGSPTLATLLDDPFIAQYATFIAPTPSWAPDDERWRVVFVLPEALPTAELYCKAQTALLTRYGTTDQSVKDAARFFFGAKPGNGEGVYLGNYLPMAEVVVLVSEYESKRRDVEGVERRQQLPPVDPATITGTTPDERYISAAVEQERQWLASQSKGTGTRHHGLMTVAAKLESLRQSDWLSPAARAGIDPYAVALDAATANGYVADYGVEDARRAITWGIGVAEPRAEPPDWKRERANGSGPPAEDPPPALPFVTAREVALETPEEPDWLVTSLLARGAITEVDAKVKAGKSTLVMDMISAMLAGRPFLGQATKRVGVLYLTEERRPTFRALLERLGLLDAVDLHILFWTDLPRAIPWDVAVTLATQHAQAVGAGLLVVDTLSKWAGLKEESENASGAAAVAMEPLERACAAGLGVLVNRHDRKSGGELGDSARGSSAFSGAADIVLALRRANTEGHESRRILLGVGRFDGVPEQLTIELQNGHYVALGDTADIEREDARRQLREILPKAGGTPMTKAAIHERMEVTNSTLDRALKELVRDGEAQVFEKQGANRRAQGFTLTAGDDPIDDVFTYRKDPEKFISDHVYEADVPPEGSNELFSPHPPEKFIRCAAPGGHDEAAGPDDVSGDAADELSSPHPIGGKFICETCGDVFPFPYQLTNHSKWTHPAAGPREPGELF